MSTQEQIFLLQHVRKIRLKTVQCKTNFTHHAVYTSPNIVLMEKSNLLWVEHFSHFRQDTSGQTPASGLYQIIFWGGEQAHEYAGAAQHTVQAAPYFRSLKNNKHSTGYKIESVFVWSLIKNYWIYISQTHFINNSK